MRTTASRNFELWVLRQQTQYLIEANPIEIALIPSDLPAAELPDGGFDYSNAVPRAIQVFRLVDVNADFDGIVPTDDGEVKKFNYILIGVHNAIVQIGDHWEYNESIYEVTAILVNNDYEVKAGVISFGKAPSVVQHV